MNNFGVDSISKMAAELRKRNASLESEIKELEEGLQRKEPSLTMPKWARRYVKRLKSENESMKEEIEKLKAGLRLKDKALVDEAEENLVLESENEYLENEVNRLERENSELLAEVKSWTVGNN